MTITFAIKSAYNNKYLAYNKEEGEAHGLVKFSSENVNILSAFQLVPSRAGGELVHIKSAYNNKYWRRMSPQHYWIVAEADEPEEDQSSWSSTLFKPLFIEGDGKTLQLWHVQLGHYACSWRVSEPYAYGLYAASPNPDHDNLDIFTVVDLGKLAGVFSLKSPYNNKYLAYNTEEGEAHGLVKFSADDVNILTIFKTEPAKCGNGYVHIKSSYNNKYWRRMSPQHYWIVAEADEPEEDQSKWSCTVFIPLLVDGDTTLQLWHVQLGHYACSWRVGEPYAYGLFAASPDPDHDKLNIFTITQF